MILLATSTASAQSQGGGSGGSAPPPTASETVPAASTPADDDAEKKDDADDDKKAEKEGGGDSGGTALDDLKGGKLIRYGVTAGVGGALMWGKGDSVQQKMGESSMPYIAIFPLKWAIRGDVTRAYCAATWTGSEDAQKDANNYAIKLTIRRMPGLPFERIKMVKELADSPELIKQVSDPKIEIGSPEFTKIEATAMEEKESPEKLLARARVAAALVYRYTGWDLTMAGRCYLLGFIPTWVGGYVGVPGKYSANAQFSAADAEVERDFKPRYSVGVTLSPLASVSLMFGYTRASVKKDADGAAQDVGAWTFSLGANLDLIGFLFGG